MKMTLRSGLLLSVVSLAACSGGPSAGPADVATAAVKALQASSVDIPAVCDDSAFCAGAAKADLSPSDAHIAGIMEPRLGGQMVLQKFHLGGFGIGPFDAFGPANDYISQQAARRPYHLNGAGQDERTYLRVMYLTKPGSGVELVFGVIDAVGAGNLIFDGVRKSISDATGVPMNNVLIGATHSHAGADLQGLWGGVPQDWVKNTLFAGAADAAIRAKSGAHKVNLRYASGRTSDFNNYRRPRRVRGEDADDHLSLLVARDVTTHRTVASLMQYAAHPTNIGTDAGGDLGRAVHGDYILGATQALEADLGGTAVYYNGPIADASPSGPGGSDDYDAARNRGTALANKAIEFFGLQSVQINPQLALAQKTVLLPVTNPLFVGVGLLGAFNRYYDFLMLPYAQIPGIGPIAQGQQSNLPQITPTAQTLVSRVTLGGLTGKNRLEIVTIPGETTNSYGRYIRSLATTPNMMLMGLTHNSFGYILPEDEFNYISEDGDSGFTAPFTGYEEFVSLGPLTATLLRIQAYNPLFNQPPEKNVPPTVTSCFGSDPFGSDCFLAAVARRPDFIQKAYLRQCHDNGLPEAFCALVDPQTPLAQPCRDAGFPETMCEALGEGDPKTGPASVSAGTIADCTDGNPFTPCPLPIESTTPVTPGSLLAGVGVADMTPDVGYCAGQYCDLSNYPDGLRGGAIDPWLHAKTKYTSYGVQSRATARALVVQGSNGKRVALVKSDNYLAQDYLMRRVGQLLDQGPSGIRYEQILYHVTHAHSSVYSSTPSFGVWLFQDAFDQRQFEFQARKIASAIEIAAANMKPARMGATVVQHVIYKGNVVRLATADDGTPAGYPLEYGDHGLTVLRFDDLSNPSAPRPLAAWINWGEHPESLEGYNLHSSDYLASLERFVDRDLGAPLVFSQGDVGSAENTGNSSQMRDDRGNVCGQWPRGADAPTVNACPQGQGVVRDWDHEGYVQTERNVRYLADDVIRAWNAIGAGRARVPFTTEMPVDYRDAWVPGPLSHPYPSVSNCRTDPTAQGDVGAPVLGLPDCSRDAGDTLRPLAPAFVPIALAVETMKAEGIPVPDQYDATAFMTVEENLRLKLQAFRLGDVLLASCACEAQADLILNLESRADDVPNNIYDGFDWACLLPGHESEQVCVRQKHYYDPAQFPTAVPGFNFAPAAIAHMRAEVHNDARGWDAPSNALFANTEPVDIAKIWGNFTQEELPPEHGYRLVVGVGHAGDYNGYTVSFREYQNRDSYRKALTSYGPHTADYMVTRLVRMAGAMKGGPELAAEPHDVLAVVDEARQSTAATALGALTGNATDVYFAALPDDVGPAATLTQPASIERFDAATFSWRGGSNAIDNPVVRVEREIVPGLFVPFADMTGEVQTMIKYPEGVAGLASAYTGSFAWKWTANFEAYSSFPARLGTTPAGNYRFVVDGRMRQGHATRDYHLVSDTFSVSPWSGIPVTATKLAFGSLRIDSVASVSYPASYASPFPFIDATTGDARICDQCTFRPWARTAKVSGVRVSVLRKNGTIDDVVASRRAAGTWFAPTRLRDGDVATVQMVDRLGNVSAPVTVH